MATGSIPMVSVSRGASGSARITLEADKGGRPSGDPLVAWPTRLRDEPAASLAISGSAVPVSAPSSSAFAIDSRIAWATVQFSRTRSMLRSNSRVGMAREGRLRQRSASAERARREERR